MQQHEVKNVVQFEISKYIPFSLEDLSFSFHPITITENGKRIIRIIFVAIKSDTLTNYVRVLRSASLHVNIVEPATSSLIRALSFKNLIPKNQTVALVEKEGVGRITIIDNNIPQFVREFDLSTASNEQTEGEKKELSREVRISLDYFNRQNEHLNVKKILYLTMSGDEDSAQNLEKSLGVPVTAIAGNSVLGGDTAKTGEGILNAYGTSIASSLKSPASFNLFQKKSESSKYAQTFTQKPINPRSLIKTALVCIPLIIASIVISILPTQKLKDKMTTLNQELASYQDSNVSFIEQKEKILKLKLNFFQSIRIQSDATLFLLLIPDLLPNGVWLRNFDIVYDDAATFTKSQTSKGTRRKTKSSTKAETTSPLVIAIGGYTYSENKSEQFRLVNTLLGKLKASAEFSSFFQDIYLETISAENLDEYDVTYFKIVCKQSDEYTRLK